MGSDCRRLGMQTEGSALILLSRQWKPTQDHFIHPVFMRCDDGLEWGVKWLKVCLRSRDLLVTHGWTAVRKKREVEAEESVGELYV